MKGTDPLRSSLLTGDTLTENFLHHTRASPDAVAVFPGSEERISGAQLGESSLRCAVGLMEHGVGPGAVVGLLVPTDARFLTLFFGVQRTGAACSVLPLPAGFGDEQGTARRLARILRIAGIRHLVLGAAFENLGSLLAEQVPGLVLIDPAVCAPGGAHRLPAVDPIALSVVQFTSGSTSAPKGVMLTQSAMAAGLRACVVSGEFSPDDVFMQWVPTFHDMGLVGLCSHLLNGADVHVFTPTAFLRRPAQLLTYFAEHRGTVITGPNFSYDQFVDAAPPELVKELDLSAWRLAFNGAEPVSAGTAERFTTHLAPAGLRDSVMYPVYGMAEATLGITFPRPGSRVRVLSLDRDELAATGRVVPVERGVRGAKDAVALGSPVHGIDMRLVSERRPGVRAGRTGRGADRRTGRDLRLLQRSPGHRGRLRRTLVPHRRRRVPPRGRPVRDRAHQGHGDRPGPELLPRRRRGRRPRGARHLPQALCRLLRPGGGRP